VHQGGRGTGRRRRRKHICRRGIRQTGHTPIYTGRISAAQAKRPDEMQAMADGLSLLANTVMAWNTMQMQAVVNRWANRRQVIEADIMAKIAPTRLSGINLRGVFRFPVERYAADLMPSLAVPISAAVG